MGHHEAPEKNTRNVIHGVCTRDLAQNQSMWAYFKIRDLLRRDIFLIFFHLLTMFFGISSKTLRILKPIGVVYYRINQISNIFNCLAVSQPKSFVTA